MEIGSIGAWSSGISVVPRSPYTPEPEAYRMRGTPAHRIASTTALVSAVPSRKSTVGSRIAAAMSGFEAMWMTAP